MDVRCAAMDSFQPYHHDFSEFDSSFYNESLFFSFRYLILSYSKQIFIPHGGQPADKNPHTYLPFRYNGYRYPRIAKNIRENRKLPTGNRNGHDSVANTDIGAARDDSDTTSHDGLGALYRAFRPRYLCYLKRTQHVFANGEPVYILETKSVTKVHKYPSAIQTTQLIN